MSAIITLIGNLGGDPDSAAVGDTTVCNFSVASNTRIKGEDHTNWFRVAAWGKLGETCQKFLSKGRRVQVVGRLNARDWSTDDKSGTSLDVNAMDVQFLGGANEEGEGEVPY